MSVPPTKREPDPSLGFSLGFEFDPSYARALEGLYVPARAVEVPQPKLLVWNQGLADELGLDAGALADDVRAAIFSGNRLPDGARPIAQAYAGHQFGGFVPQLGDGRALLLGEVIDRHGRRRDIQLKGSGPTPFSRGGDGKAPLGAVLREHLIGEAMHALGIPTTRALASVATGETVRRELPLPGGVLTRVAASHIRVGTFQYAAARGDVEMLRRLADYTLERHAPAAADAEHPYLALLTAVRDAQADLVARWMHVGFVHGVMNTDNTTISGETIDYGPCAFIDAFDAKAVFSSIDRQGRYAYGNQPPIAAWNLARLAEALLPLIDADQNRAIEQAESVIHGFGPRFEDRWLIGMRAKLGLETVEDGDVDLAHGYLALLDQHSVDFTLGFRRLADVIRDDATPDDATPDDTQGPRPLFADPAAFDAWATSWRERLGREDVDDAARIASMNRSNPLYIPRNHRVESALTAAVEEGDLAPFEALLAVVEHPFDEVSGHEDFAVPPPDGFGPYRTFCGT